MFNNLTLKENLELMEWYHLECDKDLSLISANEEFVFATTAQSDMVIQQLRYFALWPKYSLKNNSEEYLKMVEATKKAKTKYINSNADIPADTVFDTNMIINFPKEMHQFYKELPKQMKQRLNTQIDGLNLMQYIEYCISYYIDLEAEADILEFTGNERLRVSKQTEDRAARIARIWDLQSNLTKEERERGRAIANEYGLTEETQITSEWIFENPYEAYYFIESLPPNIYLFEDSYYRKIFGKEE